MQTSPSYRTNRDLFSNYYLEEYLPESEAWDQVDDEALQHAYNEIEELYEQEKDLAPERGESGLEEKFIRPMFRKLGIPFEVEEKVKRTQRFPDYGFFPSEGAARKAFERRNEGGDFYEDAVAVADAKRWSRPLDTRGEHERDFENPSYQIHVYLQETPARWGVLTDGQKWRLYYGPMSHRLDSYYEIDLPTVLEEGDLEDFKYFYLFFRHEAFLEDASGDCFLDDVYDESNLFSQELGEDLQENIYDAIKVLSDGFLEYSDNDLSEETLAERGLLPSEYNDFERARLDLVHDSALICLYRLIFVLYAESESRELLETDNAIYEDSYSLNSLKQTVAEELDSANPKYQPWMDDLWSRLDGLFELIDQGSESRGIDPEVFYVPAYNGGLFRTDPDADDDREAKFLARYEAGDSYVARVIELLTRSEDSNGGGKIFVDYSSLDVRHLGSIYEGILEYDIAVADEPLTLDDGEYVPADDGEEVIVEEGELYLLTDVGERKAMGSYYTPEYVVEYIVENTLGPLVEEIREDLVGQSAYDEGGFAAEFAERVFGLKVLDPAMGSGHFLVNAIDYLAREIVDAQERQAEQEGVESVAAERDINWARRQVAQRCIYGVDVNPLATELAKVSLWLRTLAAQQPLAFLDHHLKTGNSLVGSDIEDVDALAAGSGTDEGPNATLADFGAVRRGTIDHLMDVYQKFVAIENRELADAKEMERKYQEIERDDLRNRLVAITNVSTAEDFDLEVPEDAYERLARGLSNDEEWNEVSETAWFQSAQEMAEEREFFHWKLEFPEAFYEVDGSDREKPGFDVVLGNPPWIDVKGFDDPDILYELYDTSFNRTNVYCAFAERSIELIRKQGWFGFITPNSYMTQSSYQNLRRLLLNEFYFDSFVRLPDGVFESVTMETAIIIAQQLSSTEPVSDPTVVLIYPPNANVSTISTKSAVHKTIDATNWDNGDLIFDIFTSDRERTVVEKIESVANQVEDGFETCLGLTPYDKHQGHTKEQIENRVFHATEQESSDHRKITSGSGINRYWLNWEGEEWIRYGEWLGAPREERFFSKPRCVVRQIVSRDQRAINAAYSDSEMFHTQVGFVLLPRDGSEMKARAITGILNSKLMTFYHQKRFLDENKDTFQKILIQDTEDFPLPGSLEVDELNSLVRQANSLVEQFHSLNLDLLDYLGTHADGQALAELYQPPVGLADSMFVNTTEGYRDEKLKLGRVAVDDHGSKLVLLATVRYKPEDPDEHETDRWGYTETDSEPVMEFVGLSKAEYALLSEFVPYAVNEADGDDITFNEDAGKTISLLDRLEDLTLPSIGSVEGGLERYLRTKERVEELEERIAKTDELIDEIVYRLYDLTDEEIEIVEKSVEQ